MHDITNPPGQFRYPRTLNEVIKKIEQEEGLEPHRIVQGVSKVPNPTLDPEMRLQRLLEGLAGLCRGRDTVGTAHILSLIEVYK